jgi:hypothetical protein
MTDVGIISPLANPEYAGTNNPPNIPATQVPMAPPNQQAPPAAPDIPNQPPSLADAISSAFLSHIASRQPPPPVGSQAAQQQAAAQTAQPSRPAPGSFGSKLVGAIGAGLTGLGDAANAGAPGASGWLSGVERTLSTRDARLSAEQQRKFEQEQQKQKDDALIARNQAETLQIQRNMYKQDAELRAGNITSGKSFIDSIRDKHEVQDNISQSDLTARVQKDPNFLQTHYARQTGEEPVFDGDGKPKVDANGNPVVTPVYSVASRATLTGESDTHEITADESSYLKSTIGASIPEGTKLTLDQYAALSGRAQAFQNTVNVLNKGRDEQLSADQKRQLNTELQDPNIQHYTAMVPGKPLAGLYQASQNANQHLTALNQQLQAAQAKGDQNTVQQLGQQIQQVQAEQNKVNNVIAGAFTTEQKEKFATEQETERHNRAEEADKAAELALKKQGLGNVAPELAGLHGEDYLGQLPPQQAAIVRAIGEGRQVLPANRKEGLALLEQVHQAYPDYDEHKVKDWQKATTEYTSGKTGAGLVRANTALAHAQSLYDETTAEAVFNPLSKDHQDREITLGLLRDEIGAAIKGGVVNQKEGEELMSSLSGGLTVGAKRERIAEVTRRLHDRIEESQTKLQAAAPSSAVKVPNLMSPKAAAAYDYIQSGGKTTQTQPQGQQSQPPAAHQVPQGATNPVYASDGKTLIGHIVNGKYVALGGQ